MALLKCLNMLSIAKPTRLTRRWPRATTFWHSLAYKLSTPLMKRQMMAKEALRREAVMRQEELARRAVLFPAGPVWRIAQHRDPNAVSLPPRKMWALYQPDGAALKSIFLDPIDEAEEDGNGEEQGQEDLDESFTSSDSTTTASSWPSLTSSMYGTIRPLQPTIRSVCSSLDLGSSVSIATTIRIVDEDDDNSSIASSEDSFNEYENLSSGMNPLIYEVASVM